MASSVRKSSTPKKGEAAAPRESRRNGGSRAAHAFEAARRASLLLKHISDPTRLAIILALAEGEQDVGRLSVLLSQSQPSISHHLALLRHGGIIAPRREASRNFYQLTEIGSDLVLLIRDLLGETSLEEPAEPPARQDVESNRPDVPEEESWTLLNRRRAELIFKKNRDGLTDAEFDEFERLQRSSLLRMQREFPGAASIDTQLDEIEARLRGEGIESA